MNCAENLLESTIFFNLLPHSPIEDQLMAHEETLEQIQKHGHHLRRITRPLFLSELISKKHITKSGYHTNRTPHTTVQWKQQHTMNTEPLL